MFFVPPGKSVFDGVTLNWCFRGAGPQVHQILGSVLKENDVTLDYVCSTESVLTVTAHGRTDEAISAVDSLLYSILKTAGNLVQAEV